MTEDIDIDMLNLQFDKITAREPLDVVWYAVPAKFNPSAFVPDGVSVSWPCGWMTKLHVRYRIINHAAPPEKQVLVIASAKITKFLKEYPIDLDLIRNHSQHSIRIGQILQAIREEESKTVENIDIKFNRALNRVIKSLS